MATVLTFCTDLDPNQLEAVKKSIEAIISATGDAPVVMDWTMAELVEEILETQKDFRLANVDKTVGLLCQRS